MVDLHKLEAAAKAATPGAWKWFQVEDGGARVNPADGGLVIAKLDIREPFSPQQNADAEFIATANPAVVLELIAEVHRQNLVIDDLATLVRRLCRQLRKAEPAGEQHNRLSDQALDYLKRKGLDASVLRSE